MAVFDYKGINAKGRQVTGLIDAENLGAAKAKLRKEGIFPSHMVESSSSGGGTRAQSFSFKNLFSGISAQELSVMTRQLAVLISASVPLVEALSALIDQIENIKLKSILSNIRDSVNEGSSLGNAMEAYPQVFSVIFVNMVKAGEASGALDTILVQLADYTEKQVRLKNKIFSAMAYPVIMACIGTLMVVGLFIFVIPKITAIFRDMKAGLPLPTKILIGVSDAVVGYWYVIIIVGVLIGYILKRYLSTETGQYRFHRYQLTIPIFGRLVRLLNVTRFASTLSTLLSSGVPLLTALGIVKNIMVNVILQDVIKESMVDVKEGVNLADALRKGKEFPPLVIHMIAVGEKTGNLENMLKIIAKNYEDQVDTTITALTSILEPLLIAVMGLTVGFVVISIMLPLMNMQSLVR